MPFRGHLLPHRRREDIGYSHGLWPLVAHFRHSIDPGLWYWKAEISADGANWASLYRSEQPMVNGVLVRLNLTTIPAGQRSQIQPDRSGQDRQLSGTLCCGGESIANGPGFELQAIRKPLPLLIHRLPCNSLYANTWAAL